MADDAGEIFVKLSADVADLKSGVDSALSELGSFAKKAEDFTEQASSSWSKFADNVNASKVVFAGIAAAIGAAAVSSLKNFAVQEDAVMDLTIAMRNQGVTSQAVVQDMLDYASALQTTTKFGDETIISVQAQLAQFGIQGEELKRVTQATLDLAAAKKIDLFAASQLLGKAFVGETGTLSRYGIIIDQGLDKTEKFGAVMKSLSVFAGTAEAQADTLSGQMAQLANVFSDLQEDIGALIAGPGKGLITTVKEWLLAVQNFVRTHPEITRWIMVVAGIVGVVSAIIGSLGVFLAFVKGPIFAAFAVLTSKFALIAAAIVGTGVVIAALFTNFANLRQSILNILSALVVITNPFINLFQVLFPGLLSNLWNTITSFISSLFTAGEGARSWIGTAANWVWTTLSSIIDKLLALVGKILPASVKQTLTAMKENIAEAGNTIVTEFGNVGANLKGIFQVTKTDFKLATDAIVEAAQTGATAVDQAHETATRSIITRDQMRQAQEEARLRSTIEENQKLYEILGIEHSSWVNNARSVSSSFFNQFGQGFADMVQKGRSFSSVMKSIWADLKRQIIAMIGQMIAKWMIWQAMTGGAGGFMPGGGGLFGKFAKGGVIGEPSIITGLRSGRQVLAGEAGPEAVVPFDRIRENNAAIAAQAPSGGNINVNVSISGQFLEGDESKWQMIIRDKIVPEIERFAMTRPIGPFTRRRGAAA